MISCPPKDFAVLAIIANLVSRSLISSPSLERLWFGVTDRFYYLRVTV
jgi:hypothetical protein